MSNNHPTAQSPRENRTRWIRIDCATDGFSFCASFGCKVVQCCCQGQEEGPFGPATTRKRLTTSSESWKHHILVLRKPFKSLVVLVVILSWLWLVVLAVVIWPWLVVLAVVIWRFFDVVVWYYLVGVVFWNWSVNGTLNPLALTSCGQPLACT